MLLLLASFDAPPPGNFAEAAKILCRTIINDNPGRARRRARNALNLKFFLNFLKKLPFRQSLPISPARVASIFRSERWFRGDKGAGWSANARSSDPTSAARFGRRRLEEKETEANRKSSRFDVFVESGNFGKS